MSNTAANDAFIRLNNNLYTRVDELYTIIDELKTTINELKNINMTQNKKIQEIENNMIVKEKSIVKSLKQRRHAGEYIEASLGETYL